MTSHDKGDANRVACTYTGCQNAGAAGVTIPLPDMSPGARRSATVAVSFMWTLAGLVGDAAVAAARCFVHKDDGYVPFPVPAPVVSRPRSAQPSVQPAPRPVAPPRSNTGSGGRPQNVPRVESKAERPQAPPRDSARAQRPAAPAAPVRQHVSRPVAPHAEAPVAARPAAGRVVPAARPVASPRLTPRSDRSWTTFGDLGFNPDVFGEAWTAHKAKKAAERGALGSEVPVVVEIVVTPEPVALESEPDTAPAETSELVVQDGPIINRRRCAKVEVVEPENFFGKVGSTRFFRRNKPVEHVLRCGLEVAVGEMPGPRLVRKIEKTERGPRITLMCGSDAWIFDMFHAFEPTFCTHVWAYREEGGRVFTRTKEGLYDERELVVKVDAFVLGPRVVRPLESDKLQANDTETLSIAPSIPADQLSA